jgi:SNF2 family DNA or RNA helicase
MKLAPSLRQRMEVVTKCGIATTANPEHALGHYITDRDHIVKSAEQSLVNLATDHIDLLLIHRPDPLMDADCSLDFVRRNKQRLEHLCDAEWDLMVVDEAHHLVWSVDAPSREYMAIEQLAERVPGVLLLTATPEQLGLESHFARLRLLDPSRFHDFEQFVEEQKNYRPVADAVALLLAGKHLSNEELNTLSDLIGEQDIEPLLQTANSERDGAEAARQELVSMLMDRHGTSRVLFRNTRNGVKGFPKRELLFAFGRFCCHCFARFK